MDLEVLWVTQFARVCEAVVPGSLLIRIAYLDVRPAASFRALVLHECVQSLSQRNAMDIRHGAAAADVGRAICFVQGPPRAFSRKIGGGALVHPHEVRDKLHVVVFWVANGQDNWERN